jgi:DNA-binding transcriptional ArsR family regulator
MEPNDFESCAERLKAMADPDRLRIVTLLRSGPLNVSEVATALDQEIANVSHHLGILRRNKIVRATKKGRFVVYDLHPDVCVTTESESPNLQVNFGCCFVNLDGAQKSDVGG